MENNSFKKKTLAPLRHVKVIKKFKEDIINANSARKVKRKNFIKPSEEIPLIPLLKTPPPKIAIYTCIIGNYDEFRKPLIMPDNCDFYFVTDKIPENKITTFTYLNAYDYYKSNDKDSVLVNRFIKMHPHLMFKDYDYSIYLDGNIQVVFDPSSLIQRIGPLGIAAHRHFQRCCIYDEGEVCKIYRKSTPKLIDKQLNDYKTQGMPSQFGLFETGILIRKHNNPACIKLMEDWWQAFYNSSKRDQLSLPYIIWKNGYKYEDIGLLGSNLRKNYIFNYTPKHAK